MKARYKELLFFLEPLYYRELGKEGMNLLLRTITKSQTQNYFARFGLRKSEDFWQAYRSGKLYEILDLWRKEHLQELLRDKEWLIPHGKIYCINLEGNYDYLCPFFDLQQNRCLYLDEDLIDDLKECFINTEDAPGYLFVEEELRRLAKRVYACRKRSDFLRFTALCYEVLGENYDLTPYVDLFVEFGKYVITKEATVVLLALFEKTNDTRLKKIINENHYLYSRLHGFGYGDYEIAYLRSIDYNIHPEPHKIEPKSEVIRRYMQNVFYVETGLWDLCEQVMFDRAFIAYYPRSENEVLEANAYLVDVYMGLDEVCQLILYSVYVAARAKLSTKAFTSLRTKIKECYPKLQLDLLKKEYVETLPLEGVDRVLFELECEIALQQQIKPIKWYNKLPKKNGWALKQRLKFQKLLELESRWEER